MITNFLMLWKKIQVRSRIYWKLIFMFAYEYFPISVWSFYYITPILSQSSETGYSQRTRQGGTSVKLSIHLLVAELIFTVCFQLEWIQCIQVELHVAVYWWLFLRGLHNKVVIVCKGVPAPLFKAPTPWPSLAPIFKIFVSPLLFSAPPPFKVF